MVWTADHVQQIEASPEDVGLSSAGMARLTRHVQAYVDAGKFPGAISMVQRRGKVVHRRQAHAHSKILSRGPGATFRRPGLASGPISTRRRQVGRFSRGRR